MTSGFVYHLARILDSLRISGPLSMEREKEKEVRGLFSAPSSELHTVGSKLKFEILRSSARSVGEYFWVKIAKGLFLANCGSVAP